MEDLPLQFVRGACRPDEDDRLRNLASGLPLGCNQQAGTSFPSHKAHLVVMWHGAVVVGHHNPIMICSPLQKVRVVQSPKSRFVRRCEVDARIVPPNRPCVSTATYMREPAKAACCSWKRSQPSGWMSLSEIPFGSKSRSDSARYWSIRAVLSR